MSLQIGCRVSPNYSVFFSVVNHHKTKEHWTQLQLVITTKCVALARPQIRKRASSVDTHCSRAPSQLIISQLVLQHFRLACTHATKFAVILRRVFWDWYRVKFCFPLCTFTSRTFLFRSSLFSHYKSRNGLVAGPASFSRRSSAVASVHASRGWLRRSPTQSRLWCSTAG